MELYKKIKEFTEICPIPINIGTYLKDASKVCNIYHEMLGLEGTDNLEKARRSIRIKIITIFKSLICNCRQITD